jgi:uncharacterized protein YjbI with pentapeptide repeats
VDANEHLEKAEWYLDHADTTVDYWLEVGKLHVLLAIAQELRRMNDHAEADLSDADLSRADLSRANLYKANLKDAYLLDADLSGAVMPDGTFHE